mmetsp:Transcript_6500/g.23027  ORF Transcript_6500/g.23027 Transcript_6500/m.23027 type:complete len:349 (-) Transcript_6500:139-1185(-)
MGVVLGEPALMHEAGLPGVVRPAVHFRQRLGAFDAVRVDVLRRRELARGAPVDAVDEERLGLVRDVDDGDFVGVRAKAEFAALVLDVRPVVQHALRVVRVPRPETSQIFGNHRIFKAEDGHAAAAQAHARFVGRADGDDHGLGARFNVGLGERDEVVGLVEHVVVDDRDDSRRVADGESGLSWERRNGIGDVGEVRPKKQFPLAHLVSRAAPQLPQVHDLKPRPGQVVRDDVGVVADRLDVAPVILARAVSTRLGEADDDGDERVRDVDKRRARLRAEEDVLVAVEGVGPPPHVVKRLGLVHRRPVQLAPRRKGQQIDVLAGVLSGEAVDAFDVAHRDMVAFRFEGQL